VLLLVGRSEKWSVARGAAMATADDTLDGLASREACTRDTADASAATRRGGPLCTLHATELLVALLLPLGTAQCEVGARGGRKRGRVLT